MSFLERDPRTLIVLLDLRNPFAYLALRPAIDFGADRGVRVDLLPMLDGPLKAPSVPGPEDDRGILHRRIRARTIAREVDTYSSARGLTLRELYRSPDPAPLHAAWLFVREQFPSRLGTFLEEAFRSYWAVELDPSSADEVEQRVVSMLDPTADADRREAFRAWRGEHGAASVDRLHEEIAARGLTRGPCYVLEDEVFVGRQHLPMIEWILGGRKGRGPI